MTFQPRPYRNDTFKEAILDANGLGPLGHACATDKASRLDRLRLTHKAGCSKRALRRLQK
jgi:hypothetical protein